MSRLVLVAVLAAACGGGGAAPSPTVTAPTATVALATSSPTAAASVAPLGKGRVEKGTFHSSALNRTMQYVVYLPPGYDANPNARYPTAYMLHGSGGDIMEWPSYGLFDTADRLMGDRVVPPFIFVLPEGDQEFWVDHVIDKRTGANGEKWGTYTAKEVVPTIDARFRTVARQDARSIGGLSMGGHGAMQLALNFPGIWSAIGAHSPSLRPEGDAPTFLGFGADFAARDPLDLILAKPDLAKTYAWWIDTAEADPWASQATGIHNALVKLAIPNEWHLNPGDHSLAYWSAHMEDYVRYYARALCGTRSCP